MRDSHEGERQHDRQVRMVPVSDAIGMVLAHDITEIRPGAFKGRAFKKGHVVRREDVDHLKRLGKEFLFLLDIGRDEMHENDAAYALARALCGGGVALEGEPKEGRINLVAARDGLLRVNRDALFRFNMLGEVMCATLHDRTMVRRGQVIAGTRAIPLVVKRRVVEEAVRIANKMLNKECGVRNGECIAQRAKGIEKSQMPRPMPYAPCGSSAGIIEVKELRKPKAGVVITGNEVYHGRVRDAFAPVIAQKIEAVRGEVVGVHYAPDDAQYIGDRLRDLLAAGADLLITTGGMSVDPDDVTRFAIRDLGATNITYGSAVLPGAMVLVGYIRKEHSAESRGQKPPAPSFAQPSADVPILGIPASGIYAKTTVFDLILPRVLAGEMIGRRELAELGHGGLCMKCDVCGYPVCPLGKG